MDGHSPDFNSIKQVNIYGVEFWRARDLMPLLGYGKKWQNFQEAISRAMIACGEAGNVVEDHFTDASKMIEVGKGGKRNVKDYALSRFACYLIAMNGDPRKAEIAAAQTYFAVVTRAHEIHQLRKVQEERLEARVKVSESYKQLADAAKHAGVQSESFGIFMDAGYLGLHRHTVEELKARKGIPQNEDYLDRIGRRELSAIDFKNTQTEGRLVDEQITGEDDAIHTHYFVGDQVRKAIEAIKGPMPEDLPPAPSIRKMVEERRRKQRKLKPGTDEQDEQGILF